MTLLTSTERETGKPATCPACGGENPADAIFCGNPECHKALGEFRYVLEVLNADRRGIEKLADAATSFIATPQFIIIHMIWFTAWICANAGWLGHDFGFDRYPFELLSFLLAIEAVLITGFLLISQNRQSAYSEKRAELDYEINIKSYRKLPELEKQAAFLLTHPETRN